MVFDDKEYKKQWYKENRERLLQKQKQYQQDNKEKITQYQKEYHKTKSYKKSYTISGWKQQGIIYHDWDLLYDVIYSLTSHCDECGMYLEGNGKQRKCVDHDHTITDGDNVRNILCNVCNLKRG